MNNSIAEVHAKDVQKVRDLLQGAISEASAAWLPFDAIMDALTMELVEMAGRNHCSAQLAMRLVEIAEMLNRPKIQSN